MGGERVGKAPGGNFKGENLYSKKGVLITRGGGGRSNKGNDLRSKNADKNLKRKEFKEGERCGERGY